MNERIIVHPPKKDKSEKYYVTVSYYVNGIRKQKRKTGFKKSSDAKEEGLKIRKKLEEQMPIIKATGSELTTYKEFAEQYMEIKKIDWTYNTMKIRKQALSHCDFANKKITDVNKMDLAKNVKKLEKTYTYNTVSSILAGWKVFLNAAVEYNYLVSAPNYKLLRNDEDLAVENVMSVENAMKLLESITDKEVQLFTLIGITAGARAGEAVDMNVNDIDFKTGTWNINHQFKYVENIGYTHDQKLKTKNSYREIPLPPRTIKAIKDFPFRTMEGYLFAKSPSYLPSKVNDTYSKLGYDITFHGLRHTYITNLIRSKQFDLQSIAKLAGDTIETITETYIHYLKEMQEENIEKIKILFG